VKLFAAFLFAGIICVFPAAARVSASASPDAARAARVLESHYHDVKTLQAVFLERYSDSQQGVQAESGTVYFSRPGRMRWEYESPESKFFISDGKTVWFYVPSDHTVTRGPIKQSTDWRTPLALLTGKAKLTQLCERLDMSAEKPGLEGNVVLSCRPRGEKSNAKARDGDSGDSLAPVDQQFDQVLLEINPETGELADVRIRQPGGIQLEYRFGNWRENVVLPESLFHFQAPEGVAIVEQPKEPDSASP
jgi:outer membrane lipoprotein carrier protein